MRILFLGFGGSIALTMHSAWDELREKYAVGTTALDDETAGAGAGGDAVELPVLAGVPVRRTGADGR